MYSRKSDAVGVRIDFGNLYRGACDPELEDDLKKLEEMAVFFWQEYSGKIGTRLAEALGAYLEYCRLSQKVNAFVDMSCTLNTADDTMRELQKRVNRVLSDCEGENLSFFGEEVSQLSTAQIDSLVQQDRTGLLAQHLSFLTSLRKENERKISKQKNQSEFAIDDPFCPFKLWSDYRQSLASALVEIGDGQRLTVSEALRVVDDDSDGGRRFSAMRALNSALRKQVALGLMQAFNANSLRRIRTSQACGFRTFRGPRDEGNQLSEASVENMLCAVRETGGSLAESFYKLVKQLTGLQVLKWSDMKLNPFRRLLVEKGWLETKEEVLAAFSSFSPVFFEHAQAIFREQRIDAESRANKAVEAGCLTAVMPKPLGVKSYVYFHYAGGTWSQRTLAHELGHAVQEELGGEQCGPLLKKSLPPVAETAAMFAEGLYFEHLSRNTRTEQERLAFLLHRCHEFIYCTIWTGCLAAMEEKAYQARLRGPLSVQDLNACWLESLKEFFGEDGDIFCYDEAESLWAAVHHLLLGGFLYCYPFASLLSLALSEVRRNWSSRGEEGVRLFEAEYLKLLRAGSSKSPSELASWFGVDLNEEKLWTRTIKQTFGDWIAEARRLVAD